MSVCPAAANPLLQVRCCGLGGQEISVDCCRCSAAAACGGRMRSKPWSQGFSLDLSRLGLKARIPVSTLLFRQISLDTYLFICRKKHETFHGCVADSFYPLDVMLARLLAMALCPSVCLSVTSRSSIETVERIELVFGMRASFHPSCTVLKENSGISKNKGTSL